VRLRPPCCDRVHGAELGESSAGEDDPDEEDHDGREVECDGETLTLEFANTPLSQFTVVYQPDRTHFRRITEPHRFETQYQSPQLESWRRNEVEWHLVQRAPAYTPRRGHPGPPLLI
jgi:hypothetical protein